MANLEEIQRLFKESGRTNQEIADIIDKPLSIVDSYEQGKKPRGSSMMRLAYALKVNVFSLSRAYDD